MLALLIAAVALVAAAVVTRDGRRWVVVAAFAVALLWGFLIPPGSGVLDRTAEVTEALDR